MSYGNRLWDDKGFRSASSPRPQPQVASQLINRLGLSRCSRAEQERAIEGWLEANHPSPRLKKSLIRAGYGALLHQAV